MRNTRDGRSKTYTKVICHANSLNLELNKENNISENDLKKLIFQIALGTSTFCKYKAAASGFFRAILLNQNAPKYEKI